MQRCADISRKYSDDDCFDEMKGEKLRMQAEKLCEDKELGRNSRDSMRTAHSSVESMRQVVDLLRVL